MTSPSASVATSVRPLERLERHLAACSRCGERWERELELAELRSARNAAMPTAEIVYTAMLSPIGTLWLAGGDGGLVEVAFGVDELQFTSEVEARTGSLPSYNASALPEARQQLSEYFRGERKAFTLQVDLRGVTAFQQAALEAVRRVPWGRVESYSGIARAIGKPSAMRAVGAAVARNSVCLVIPCHRIVRADGFGQYGLETFGPCGPLYKRMLLALEGVEGA